MSNGSPGGAGASGARAAGGDEGRGRPPDPLLLPPSWPEALRAAAGLALESPLPTFLLWGRPERCLANDAAASLLGGPARAARDRPFREVWPEASYDLSLLIERAQAGTATLADRGPFRIERDGGVARSWFSVATQPLRDLDGAVRAVVCTLGEITDRIETERALRASQAQALSLLQGIGDAFMLLDPTLRLLRVNAAAERLAGRAEDALIGRRLDAVWPEDAARDLAALGDAALREGAPRRLERWLAGADGRNACFDVCATPAGSGVSLAFQDVTERKEAESRLRAVTDSIDQMIWSTRADGFHDYYNARWYEYTGTPPGSTEGEGWAGMFHPDDRERAWARWRHSLVTGEPYEIEYRLRHRSGQYRWVLGRAQPVRDAAGRIVRWYGTCTDVHDQKLADAALRESRDRLAAESHALEVLNRTGTLIAAELTVESLVQRVVDAGVELTGAQFGAFFYTVQAEGGRRYTLYALAGAEREAFERFGMPRPTEVFAPTFRGEGVVRSDDITADPRYGKSGPHWGMPKGHLPVRSYLAVPVASRTGEVIGGLLFGHPEPGRFTGRAERAMAGLAAQAAIGIDNARLFEAVQQANAELEQRVLERTAELQRAHEALRQAQKMEAVGQLTGGIAHDFNNMLAIVIGSLDLLRRRLGAGDVKVQRHLESAMEGARRAAALTQRLLAFSRQQPLAPEPIDANRLIAGVSDLLRRTLRQEVRLETALDAGLWPIHADPNQLENALLNLAVNARDAMPDGGRLTIATRNTTLAAAAAPGDGAAPGDYVLIAVTDSGSGMAREVIEKAFDPFFTTKAVGKGTGLGLSQVYGFVRQSGGQVRIRSELGRGTTIELYLPRWQGEAAASIAERAEAAGPAAPQAAPALVLVVEDEAGVRRFSVEALRTLGYEPLAAENAAAALRLLDQRPEIALLFTDVVMPDVNGRALAEEARRRRPELKVLFTTGYMRDAAAEGGMLAPGAQLLVKPFTLDELAAKLRACLDD